MNRNLESTSQLTEFAPLSPEDKSSFGLLGFSKFFKIGKGESPEPDNESNKTAEDDWQQQGENLDKSDNASMQYSVDVSEGRSLPNVLKRISNLIALKNVGLTSYKDTDLKQYWMPDSFSKECYDCGEKFTTFRRRHHCRVCGQIFCSRCCNQEIPGKIMNCTGDLRVCTYCCKVVLSYLQSADIGADLSADLRALQEDLQIKFGDPVIKNADSFQSINTSPSSITEREEASNSIRRKPSVGYQEERFALGRGQSPSYLSEEERCRALQNSSSLRSLYQEIIQPPNGITLQSHRYRLRSFPNCFFGSELVDWLLTQNKAGTRLQGIAIGQALLEAGYLEPIGELNFIDGLSLYRPVPLKSPSTPQAHNSNESQEPLWVKQIPQQDSIGTTDSESENRLSEIEEEPPIPKSNSNYFLDINVKDNVVHVSRPSPPSHEEYKIMEKPVDKTDYSIKEDLPLKKDSNEVVLDTDWNKNSSYVQSKDGEDSVLKHLSSSFEHHKQTLLRQMLNTEGISQSWSDVVLPVVQDIVDLVRPDMKSDIDEMDIRHYVQIKKLPGGERNESCIVSGVVCSKNVAHRSMRTRISNPRILLLRCSVVYQRIEGRLLSLEPVMMQEHEYLRHVVARIAALQPDVVMVYRNVSRLAQEYLLKLDITLILNTKLSVLERVARFTEADIVTSVDAHISKPQLGTCQSFYLKTYETEHGDSKTLMFFEGCSKPELSCTLLLRGGTNSELTKLKRIVNFLIFACYNWKLEKSFLIDEFAKPPSPPSELFEESPDQNSKLISTTENKTESKVKIEREDKKITVEAIQDCSDPLQSYLNASDDLKPVETSPVEQLSVAELPFSNKFRKSLDDTILSVSLYVKFSIPYLETEAGRNCVLRKYFPNEIFYSKQFSDNSELSRLTSANDVTNGLEYRLKGVKLLPKHPFITCKITDTVNSIEVQTLLALYRANGGRIPLKLNEEEKKEVQENIKNDTKTLATNKKLDVLDPVSHQRLPVLFCSYSYSSQNSPAFCVDPWVVNMYFYGTYDIPLGSFLERYCFRPSYVCPSVTCDTPMLEHVRRFVHDPGCVHLTLNQLDQLDSKHIVMWSWCTKCQEASPVVPMSPDTWSFSFAKYLELRFRGHIYTRRDTETCKHSLHHDHFQYFGMNKIVASFKFSPIRIWEICLPSPVIKIHYDISQKMVVMDELRILAIKGHDVYSSILEKLLTLEGSEEDIQIMKLQQQKEQAHFKTKIEEIQLKLTSPSLETRKLEGRCLDKETEALLWRIEDSVVILKRLISEAVIGWNARFQDTVNAAKKKDDKEKEKQKRVSEGAIKPFSQIVSAPDNDDEDDELGVYPLDSSSDSFQKPFDNILDSANDSDDSEAFDHDEKSSDDAKDKKSYTDVVSINCDDNQTDSKHDKKTVKNILSQILTSSRDLSLVQIPWTIQEHYLLPPGPNSCLMVYENEPSSIISYALGSYDYQRYLEEMQHKKAMMMSSSELPAPSPVNRRKTLSSSSNSEKEAEDSRRSTVLSFLRGSTTQTPQTTPNRLSVDGSVHATLNASISSDNGNPNATDTDEKAEEGSKKVNRTPSSFHVEIMFADSTTNFYCRVYFVEQFAALRQTVFPVGEEAFVRSLSRCVQWAARGGKSGSTFCKTKDDRFVLKEMSKLELQLFIDFATHYFSYVQKCQETNQPTLLGKIVGVYTVSFRNSSSNSALKSNLLVMENLFYRRNVTQKYDLKGSVRNRLVNPSVHKEGEIVYLDENLLKVTTDSPLYILPHSQAVLMRAIESDTQFLASQTVMDYSLLVGLDEDRRELVVGIIDYIRTFTWDKKLETMVKKSVIMGGQGKQPTIIQPKDYRDRFIAAMHRYFLPVPDRWSGLGRTVDS